VCQAVDKFLKVETPDAKYLKGQPGFIFRKLHRGLAGSSIFINYAIWESTEHFRRAFNNVDSLQSLDLFHLGIVIACIATTEFSQLLRGTVHYLNYYYSQR
jgi:hypothetical protein